LIFLFFFLILLRGRGRGVEVGFFPSFEMWKEEGKGVIFSLKFVFRCGMAEEGKGLFFFYKFIMGGRVGYLAKSQSVEPIHMIRALRSRCLRPEAL
jgi:hypothetical protein